MGRVLWMGTKFVVGAFVGALIGAAATAYFAGAGEPETATVAKEPRANLMADLRSRIDAARVAGDLAAEEIEAAMTQQFRTKVHDPGALNPPNALHS